LFSECLDPKQLRKAWFIAALWTLRRVAPRHRTPKLSDFENVTIEARQIEDFRNFFWFFNPLKKRLR